jgi:hypothetical protein
MPPLFKQVWIAPLSRALGTGECEPVSLDAGPSAKVTEFFEKLPSSRMAVFRIFHATIQHCRPTIFDLLPVKIPFAME